MEKEVFVEALSQSRRELDELLTKKTEIDSRISRLKNTIEALVAQIEGQGELEFATSSDVSQATRIKFFDEPIGITDAIRDILRRSPTPMTAPQIRDVLEVRNFDIHQYANPLTVIHNTINRLEKQGEVESRRNALGVAIGWVHKPSRLEQLSSLMHREVTNDEIMRLFEESVKQQKK